MSFSSTVSADFARSANKGLAAHLTMLVIRIGQHARSRPLRLIWAVLDRVYLRCIIGAEIPSSVVCGPGLALPHAGRGLIVHPLTVIGSNCMIFHRVTLAADRTGAPRIGNDVLIGAGACVIGAVRLGDGCRVGANCVVVKDVPPGAAVHAAPVVERPAQ